MNKSVASAGFDKSAHNKQYYHEVTKPRRAAEKARKEEEERKAQEKRARHNALQKQCRAKKKEAHFVQWKQCSKYVEIFEKGDMTGAVCLDLVKELAAEHFKSDSKKASGWARVHYYVQLFESGRISTEACLELTKTYVDSHDYN